MSEPTTPGAPVSRGRALVIAGVTGVIGTAGVIGAVLFVSPGGAPASPAADATTTSPVSSSAAPSAPLSESAADLPEESGGDLSGFFPPNMNPDLPPLTQDQADELVAGIASGTEEGLRSAVYFPPGEELESGEVETFSAFELTIDAETFVEALPGMAQIEMTQDGQAISATIVAAGDQWMLFDTSTPTA